MRRPRPEVRRRSALVALAGVVAFLLVVLAPPAVGTLVSERLHGVTLGVMIAMVVAVAVRLGGRARDVLALAVVAGVALAARLQLGAPPVVVLTLAGLSGAEVWVVAWQLSRTGAWRLRDAADLLRYVVVVVLVAVPSGLVFAAAALSSPDLAAPVDGDLNRLWRLWAVDCLAGMLCVAPTILTAGPVRRYRWRPVAEVAAYAAFTAAASYALFLRASADPPGILGWPYLATLGAGVAAVRFGVRVAAPLSALVAITAVAGTAAGNGLFAASSTAADEQIVVAQMFAVIVTVMLLSVAVLRDARERALGHTADSLRLLHEVIDAAQSAIFVKDFTSEDDGYGRYVLVNAAWEEANGLERGAVIGRTDAELFTDSRVEMYLARDRQVLATATPVRTDDTVVGRHGEPVSFRTDKFPLRGADGSVWGVGGIAVDVTSVLSAQQRQASQTALLRAVFELSPTPAARVLDAGDSTYPIVAANEAAVALGLSAPSGRSRPDFVSYVHPDYTERVVDQISSAATLRGPRDVLSARREVRMLGPGGGDLWVLLSVASLHVPDGAEDGSDQAHGTGVPGGEVIIQLEDITARRAAEAALTDQALRDEVTGLPNRRALDERLRAALARLGRRPGTLAVMFCDLDRFKDVNDSLGHHAGDDLLMAVANELRAVLRPSDSIARLGGDEFVVVGEDLTEAQDAIAMAARLQARLRAAWSGSSTGFRPTMSMGVAITHDPAVSAEELLRRADVAMYRAKEKGRDRIEVYDQEIDDAVKRAVAVQQQLRLAVEEGTLELHYQPVVRLEDRQVVGAEGLVRMRSAVGALLGPGDFIDEAEKSGLIVPMGSWVVRQALADLGRLDGLLPGLYVGVNVSPTQLRDAGFAEFLLHVADRAGVAPERILVEVTETALLHDATRSAAELGALSAAGVGVALDDFGTGFSSLSWLTDFPVDVVKIDRSFTADIVRDDRKAAVVRAITSASEEIGFSVVAEGVETEDQLSRLVELGCDLGQGYLFGRPTRVGEGPWAVPMDGHGAGAYVDD